MPMYWTFNCFLGCIYTVYHIVYIVFLVLNWLSNLEFWPPKKRGPSCPNWGHGGGGLGNSGNARKKTFFFNWGLPLLRQIPRLIDCWSEEHVMYTLTVQDHGVLDQLFVTSGCKQQICEQCEVEQVHPMDFDKSTFYCLQARAEIK